MNRTVEPVPVEEITTVYMECVWCGRQTVDLRQHSLTCWERPKGT